MKTIADLEATASRLRAELLALDADEDRVEVLYGIGICRGCGRDLLTGERRVNCLCESDE